MDVKPRTETTGLRSDHPLSQRERRRRLQTVARVGTKPASLTIGGGILLSIVIASLVAPQFSKYGSTEQLEGMQLLPPSRDHYFGTDVYGMDVFTRTFAAARYDLGVALLAATIGMTVGVLLGAIAGYVGRIADEMLSRGVEALQSFPPLILALALVAAVGASTIAVVVVIGVVQISYYFRVVRAQVMSLREREFIDAARGIGLSTPFIVMRHILPNAVRPAVVQFALNIGTALLLIAALSFIGLGAQVPQAEWGSMVAVGLELGISGEWWVWAFPGAMILLSVIALNMVGDGVRDFLDPRMR